MKPLCMAICLLLAAHTASADVSGAELQKFCAEVQKFADGADEKTVNGLGFGYCTGLVDGFRTGYAIGALEMDFAGVSRICIPPTSTTQQLALVVLKYLKKYPEALHARSGDLAYEALLKAFVCTGTKD